MKTVKIQKLFNGKASIRSYLVSDAIKNNEPLLIIFNTQTMILSPEELKLGITDGNKYTSNWDNKEYQLVDFDWCQTEQLSLV